MRKNDTIVAIATPHGVGGIAVVRLSGPDALTIATKHLKSPLTSKISTLNTHHLTLTPRVATYCHFDDIDDGIATYFPVGYTGEPTVEFSCHGSTYIQEAILEALIASGARLAEPGEYTLRAFLSGKLNLSQAEAVADLIEATTPAQHQLAVSQLRGGYALELEQLRSKLTDLSSLLELELDFSQEDVEFADRGKLIALTEETLQKIESLRQSFRAGNALKRGIPIAIVGRPNAGKSSLLNLLLHDDRAIVSDIPGTTRDTIEDTFSLQGLPFRIIDTAGLRNSDDPIESLGIERTRKAIADAHIVLYVHDATTPWQEPDLDLADKHVVIILNKSDLLTSPHTPFSSHLSPFTINFSAKTGTGLSALTDAIANIAHTELSSSSNVMLSNARHYDALGLASQALQQVLSGLQSDVPSDLIAIDLRDALHHLGSITGQVTTDELLGNIFSRFCIGK